METPFFVTYSVELTDTFSGQANYSWVRRAQITVSGDMQAKDVLVKAAQQVSCSMDDAFVDRIEDTFDGYAVYFIDNVVMFVSYWNDSETSPDEYENELGNVTHRDDSGYDYIFEHGGLTIATPAGSCFLQGDEASELYELLEANPLDIVRILSAYEHICE